MLKLDKKEQKSVKLEEKVGSILQKKHEWRTNLHKKHSKSVKLDEKYGVNLNKQSGTNLYEQSTMWYKF